MTGKKLYLVTYAKSTYMSHALQFFSLLVKLTKDEFKLYEPMIKKSKYLIDPCILRISINEACQLKNFITYNM